MMMRLHRFNIYLSFVALLALAMTGCRTDKDAEDKKKGNEVTYLALHMEVTPDGLHDNEPVPIFRADPQYVNISKEPFLDSKDISEAKLLEAQDGTFSIQVKFTARGQLLLDVNTTQYRGKRIVVMCKWSEERWIASPVIKKRITDGTLVFVPDATKEEAVRIVLGLNNIAKELKKAEKDWF